MVRRSSSIVPGRVALDLDGLRHIEIEAGARWIGPTYRPYPAVLSGGRYRPVGDDADPSQMFRLPNTSTELYVSGKTTSAFRWLHRCSAALERFGGIGAERSAIDRRPAITAGPDRRRRPMRSAPRRGQSKETTARGERKERTPETDDDDAGP